MPTSFTIVVNSNKYGARMQVYFPKGAIVLAGLLLAAILPSASGQEAGSTPPATSYPAAGRLPDAPAPQRVAEDEMAAVREQSTQTAPAANGQAQNATPAKGATAQTENQKSAGSQAGNAAQSSSSSAPSAQQAGNQESQHQKAEEQLKEQEHQRVAGVMATFNTTRNPNALPLSPGQKFELFFKGAFDPWAFGLNAAVAGIDQASDADPEWGQGMKGYSKRFGAAYTDYFTGNFFGNAVLPSLLHEDPRYFQKGSGRFMSRFLWAAGSTVWCKRDRGGWGPNWGNVGGNLIGAAIARTYYPASERTVSDTISDGLTVSAEGVVGAEIIEFWPDMVRHHRRKQAEKQARAVDAASKKKAREKQNQN